MSQRWDSTFDKPPQSYWMGSIDKSKLDSLKEDIKVDAAIVGGGIVGITTAYLLKKEGLKVVLLEADRILHGTTGHTTAKITCQHDLIYDKIKKKMGMEMVAQYYDANQMALQWITSLVEEKRIVCDFVPQPAYVYTQSDDYIQKIQDEADTAKALAIPSEYVEEIPLPYAVKAALRFDGQAQFHPLKFLNALAGEIPGDGSAVYEQTRAVDIHNGKVFTVTTGQGHKVTAKKVVIATHFPFYDGYGMYFTRLFPDRSYALGITISEEYPGGMYITAEDPGRSLRSQAFKEGTLIIVGGEHHKTGQGPDTRTHYENLMTFSNDTFTVKDIPYRWSTQDYSTPDDVPYVGLLTAATPNLYVACGFRKWGMTNGTASAHLLKDLIIKGVSPWQTVYNPSRFTIAASAKNFVVENADVAKHLITGKLASVPKTLDIGVGEAKVVEVDGQKLGAFRDTQDKIHWVDTTCPHLGCELHWNTAERSWDCPCHGSRFTYEGEIIEGPAQKPLHKPFVKN